MAARCADSADRALTWAWLRSSAGGPTTTGPGPKNSRTGPAAFSGVGHTAEHDHEPVALGGAQRVHAGGPRRAAYVVEQVGLAALLRHRAQHHRHGAAVSPAERAGAGEHRLVGLGAQHRVDDERLETGVPGAADLGGPGVDLRRGEGDLAAVAEHPGVHVAGVFGPQQVVEVALDDLDAEPDQVDGLLEVDDAGQRPGRRPEDAEATALPSRSGCRDSSAYQSMKLLMPACTITPTQERSSALSSRNHGISSIRAIAAVLSTPVDRCRSRTARERGSAAAREGTMPTIEQAQTAWLTAFRGPAWDQLQRVLIESQVNPS